MVREVIEGIKQTEAEAAAILENARKQKADMAAKAREDAKKIVDDARKRGAEAVKQALAKAAEDAKVKIEEIAGQEKSDGETLRQASSSNIGKAVDLVVERILE
jgi:vacuolar-type H+-ATPase subunit H